MAYIKSLHIYPLKSAGGVAVSQATVSDRGFAWDRRWMVVDANGVFVSQRTAATLARLRVELHADHLSLHAPHGGTLDLPLAGPDLGATLRVRIWNDWCVALCAGDSADRWMSDYLQRPCRVVYMPDATVRPADAKYVNYVAPVSFADGFPYLLLSDASLADLNTRLAQPVPMERFRPNIVVGDVEPYAEDTWDSFSVGDLHFNVVKPCARCVMVNIDQGNATLHREPLRTLTQYRRVDNKALFGQNLVHQGVGTLQVGMSLRDIVLVPST